jgi:hypothetical protein
MAETVTRVPVTGSALVYTGPSGGVEVGPGGGGVITVQGNGVAVVGPGTVGQQVWPDYEITGLDPTLGIFVQGFAGEYSVGTLVITNSGSAGSIQGASGSATWSGKQVTVTVNLDDTAAAPVTFYVTSIYATIYGLQRSTTGTPTPTRPALDISEPGYRVTWTRHHRVADVALTALGVMAHLTWARFGMVARPMLLVGLRRTVQALEKGGYVQEDAYEFVRHPGTTLTGGVRWFRIGYGHIDGPEQIG